jgi:hypothetical protein
MDLISREELCNECLDFVERAASAARKDADEGAFQKSDTLRQIVTRINEVLTKIDSANK